MLNRVFIRRKLSAVLILPVLSAPLSMLAATPAAAQSAAVEYVFDLPAGELEAALVLFSTRTGVTVSFTPDVVAGHKTRGLQGTLLMDAALEQLLAGTSLQARKLSNGSYSIVDSEAAATGNTLLLDPVRVKGSRIDSGQFAVGAGSGIGSQTRLDATELARSGVRTWRDLGSTSANFSSFDGGGNRMTQFSIRGVREQSYQSAPEVLPSVSYYVDDVPALTTLGRVSLFSNLESVAIDKGAQVSGYGFSRPGGVINVRTKEPAEQWQGRITAGIANYSARELQFDVSGALIPQTLLLSVDGITAQRDGFYNNTLLNTSYGDKDAFGGRLKLSYKPSDSTDVDLTVQREAFRDQADPYTFSPQSNADAFEVAFDNPGREDITQELQALRVRSNFNGMQLLSVTAHRESSWQYRADAVQYGAAYDEYVGMTDEDIDSLSQEFRLASDGADGRGIQWSVGVFYADTRMDYNSGFLFNDGVPAFPLNYATTESTDRAVFGDFTVAFADIYKLSLGLRYEHAQREGRNGFTAPAITLGDNSYSELLPSVALTMAPADTMQFYARYARGFKAGGFNARAYFDTAQDFEYTAETSDVYEIGGKFLLADGDLSIDTAVFYTDFSGYQNLIQISPSDFGIDNAQSATSQGLELSLSYQFETNFRVFAAFGYTKAEFNDLVNNYGDFSGRSISFVPRHTVSYGLEYDAGSGVYCSVRGQTQGEYYLDDGNAAKQDSFTLVNLVAGYRWRNIDVAAFVDNLGDETYVVVNTDTTGTGMGLGALGDPRQFGLRLRMGF